MSDEPSAFTFITEQFIPALKAAFPEISGDVAALPLPGIVYRVVRLLVRFQREHARQQQAFFRQQPVPLPDVELERHPDEIRAFFSARPWYEQAFENELELIGDHFSTVNTAAQILPAGDPPEQDGEGYLSHRWKQFPWMAELFQEHWEREQYQKIVELYRQLPREPVEKERVPGALSPYLRAQLELDSSREEELEQHLAENVYPILSGADLWEDEEFWTDLRDWVEKETGE